MFHGDKLKLGPEVKRIGLGWVVLGKLSRFSNRNDSLKRKGFGSCVLPVLTYGAEKSTLSIREQAQNNTERNGTEYTWDFV